MKFHLSITEEDYIAFNIHHAFHSESGKKVIQFGRFVPTVVAAVFYMIFLLAGMERRLLIVEGVALLVVCLVGYFKYPDLYRKSLRNNILKLKKEGRLPFSPETDLEFTETEMIETAPDGVKHTPYDAVIAIDETAEHVFIKIGALQSFILPIRCLDGRKQELLDYLRNKCANAAQ